MWSTEQSDAGKKYNKGGEWLISLLYIFCKFCLFWCLYNYNLTVLTALCIWHTANYIIYYKGAVD